MSKGHHQQLKEYYNFLPLRFMYVFIFAGIGIYWTQYRSLCPHLFSQAAVLWILNLYRGLNKDKTSIENQFFISFWVRKGWGVCNYYYHTGHLYADKEVFASALIQCFLITAFYTALPLHYIQAFWSNRICRWMIFIIDQSFTNGFAFDALVKRQLFTNPHSTGYFMGVIISRALARPTMQIITGFFNKNLFWNNLRKWSIICYLNTSRILLLSLINYWVMSSWSESKEQMELLQYFNVCYYGLVGYLMYLETYSL